MSMAFCIPLCLLMMITMFGTAAVVNHNVHCKGFPEHSKEPIVNALSQAAGPSAGPVEKYCGIHTAAELENLENDKNVEKECNQNSAKLPKHVLVGNCAQNNLYCDHYAIFLGCEPNGFKVVHQTLSGMSTAVIPYAHNPEPVLCGRNYEFLHRVGNV